MTRGYLVMAQGAYIRAAEDLAISIRATQTGVNKISVITDQPTRKDLFEHVIPVPAQDLSGDAVWKIHNRAYFYDLSPYDETVILDADMLFLTDVGHWWNYISKHDFLTTTCVKTYRNTWVEGNAYRAAFRANNLINAYSAFTYFKKAELSQEIFYWIKQFMSDWDSWSRYLIPVDRQQFPSIDLGLAMAVKLLDCEQQVTSTLNYPTFTHMKSGCQGWARSRENWEDVLGVYNDGTQIKIGPYVQSGILHYVKKDFVIDSIRNMFL
jgi:hypothetical protein